MPVKCQGSTHLYIFVRSLITVTGTAVRSVAHHYFTVEQSCSNSSNSIYTEVLCCHCCNDSVKLTGRRVSQCKLLITKRVKVSLTCGNPVEWGEFLFFQSIGLK